MAGRTRASSLTDLARDYGLTVGLLVVSGVLLSQSTLPKMRDRDALERTHRENAHEIERLRERREALEATNAARGDALVEERFARHYFGDMALPANEIPLRVPGDVLDADEIIALPTGVDAPGE